MPVTPPSSTPPATYDETVAFTNLPVNVQNILKDSLSLSELNALFPTQTPVLPQPVLLKDFFDIVAQSMTKFQHQLQLAEFTQQIAAIAADLGVTIAAQNLGNIYNGAQQVDFDDQVASYGYTNNLFAQIGTMSAPVTLINQQIANLRANDSTFQDDSSNLIQAYEDFINAIDNPSIATHSGTTWTILDANAYNTALNTYLTSTGGLNAFNASLSANGYDPSTYKTTADANNAIVQGYITSYHLDTNLPPLPTDSWLDPTPYLLLPAPLSVSTSQVPANVIIENPTAGDNIEATPYNWIGQVSNDGPDAFADLVYSPDTSPGTQTDTYNAIFAAVNGPHHTQNTTQIKKAYDQWIYLQMHAVFNPPIDNAIDPFDNSKPLIHKLLNSFISPTNAVTTQNSGGTSFGANLSTLSNPDVRNMLGMAIVQQVINSLSLNITPEQAQTLGSRLVYFSASLINNNALLSTLPGLGYLSPQELTDLPQNSPVFSVLFAISFANRIIEGIGKGVNTATLASYLENTPELSGIKLSDNDIKSLASAINTGLLLVAIKLISITLGLPQLVAQLLGTLLPPEAAEKILNEIPEVNNQSNTQLQNDLEQALIASGSTPEEAKFIAQFIAAAVSSGQTLSPTLATVSSDNVQLSLLINSVTANLILAGFSLEQAQSIANTAVEKVLAKGTLSLAQFTRSLEFALRSQGVKNASQVASQAVIVPATDDRLNPLTGSAFKVVPAPVIASSPQAPVGQPYTPPPSTPAPVVSSTPPPSTPHPAYIPPPTNVATTFGQPIPPPEVTSTSSPATEQPYVPPPSTPPPTTSKTSTTAPVVTAIPNATERQPYTPPPAPVLGAAINPPTPALGAIPTITPTPGTTFAPTEAPTPIPGVSAVAPTTTAPATPPSPTETIPQTNRPLHLLSENQIVEIITERILQLIPALDPKLKQEIPAHLALALFGTTNPDSQDIADVKSIHSVVNVLRNQLYNLKIDQNDKYFNATSATFKETIKDSAQLSVFLEKLMNPANLFLYSVGCGIMYAGNGPAKKTSSIDIQV